MNAENCKSVRELRRYRGKTKTHPGEENNDAIPSITRRPDRSRRQWGPRAHVPALKGVPEAELYAVCTAHADTAQAAASKFEWRAFTAATMP